jgi:hypothetical protein
MLAGIGWYVKNASDSTNKTLTQTNNTSLSPTKKSKTATTADETANWLVYTSSKKSFSMKIPDGWKLIHNDTDNLYAFSSTNLSYKPGVKATIEEEAVGGRDGPVAFSAISRSEPSKFDRSQRVGEIKSENSTGIKYYFEQKEEPQGPDLAKGAKEYDYYFVKGSNYVTISFSYNIGETDNSALVEKTIKTLEIN